MPINDTNNFPGNVNIGGQLTARGINVPNGTLAGKKLAVGDPDDAAPVEAISQQRSERFSQSGPAAGGSEVVFVANADAVIRYFSVGAITPASGGATATFDLKKNGTSVLTAPVTIGATNAAYGMASATLASTDLVDGDVLTVVITSAAPSGSLAAGLFASLIVNEDPVT